jgi:phosphohistidine phosphatase
VYVPVAGFSFVSRLFRSSKSIEPFVKTLFLMRHAKSDWGHFGLADRDRPLNERGRRDAPFMAKQLLDRQVGTLDLLICSPALRTRTTAALVAQTLGYDAAQIRIEDELYEASRENYFAVIKRLDSTLNRVLILGHNNTITDVVNSLSPQYISELPTAGIVALHFNVKDWTDATRATAKFGFFDYPKM